MTKKSEEAVLEVINTEQLERLPKKIYDPIVDLAPRLDVSATKKFNPLIKTLLEIDSYLDLKYDPEDEESVKAFKKAKGTIRSFNSAVGRAKTEMKKPYKETGDKIVAIEKVLKSAAATVLEKLEEEFKPYLDAEEEKKRLAQEKKDKEKNEKIEELTNESSRKDLTIERQLIVSKYEKAKSTMLQNAISHVGKYSKEALEKELEAIKEFEFDVLPEEKEILLDDQFAELKADSAENVENIIGLYEDAIKKATVIGTGEISSMRQEDAPVFSMMVPSEDSFKQNYIHDSLDKIVGEAVFKAEQLEPATEKEISMVDSFVENMKQYRKSIDAYFEAN